ncbi:MAG TPA: GspE/PulE family protein [bacterium]|nr:GspE/PulE family protein [bacterium]
MATPSPAGPDSILQRILDLLHAEGLITPEQRREVLVRAPQQRNRLLMEKRAAAARMGRKRRTGIEVAESEVIASFELPMRTAKKPAGGATPTVTEDVIGEVIARDVQMPFVRLDPLKLDFQFVTKAISGPFAERHSVVPMQMEEGFLKVAVANPYDTEMLEQLPKITGQRIRTVVATHADVQKIAVEFWGFRSSVKAAQADLTGGVDLGNLEQFIKARGVGEIDPTDKPVVQAVWYLFNYAFEQRASDIHIEPKRELSQVRLRIDGVLHDIYTLPKLVHNAVVSRIKMLARMDIAEKRRPQDGRIKTTFKEKEVELRVSALPVAFGEKIVLRIFDPDVLLQELEDIGLFQRELTLFNSWIERPHGMILVTGPTGSGKTTTLYSALKALANPEVNITTIEDPIEMVHDEFNQVAIQPKIDVTFASALRSILRQDPDIIMVGEIRDKDTADNAIQAALTGHLVLSTLHTNDTASAVTRLLDLEVLPFLIGSTLIGVVAQRLVRTICADCARDTTLKPDEILNLRITPPKGRPLTVRYGEGCVKCRNTGYRGRTGIFELMEITPKVAKLITARAPSKDIKADAISDGMMTLRECAIKKMAQGITTYEEVLRVTSEGL